MNRSLKIAMLSLHSCPLCKPGSRYNGGMSIYIRELAQELASHGHSVDIFTCTHGDEEHTRELRVVAGVRLIHIESGHPERLSAEYLDPWINQVAALIISSGSSYDLIHSHYWLSGLVGIKLVGLWKIPHVAMFHTLGALKNKAGLGEVEPGLRLQSESAIAAASDAIIATTEREITELITTYETSPDKVCSVPCGVNICTFGPMDQQVARRLCGLETPKIGLFVGRSDPIKGLDRLLAAVQKLNRQDFQLVIIGGESNKNRSSLRSMNPSQSKGNIHFVGPVPYKEMVLYYNSADLCIIPSYYESFSLVALESLACGTPVLSTDVGGIKKIVGNCDLCRVVPTIAEDSLSDEINYMLGNERFNSDTREQLSSLINDYSWDKISQRVIAVYNNSIYKSQNHMITTACR